MRLTASEMHADDRGMTKENPSEDTSVTYSEVSAIVLLLLDAIRVLDNQGPLYKVAERDLVAGGERQRELRTCRKSNAAAGGPSRR